MKAWCVRLFLSCLNARVMKIMFPNTEIAAISISILLFFNAELRADHAPNSLLGRFILNNTVNGPTHHSAEQPHFFGRFASQHIDIFGMFKNHHPRQIIRIILQEDCQQNTITPQILQVDVGSAVIMFVSEKYQPVLLLQREKIFIVQKYLLPAILKAKIALISFSVQIYGDFRFPFTAHVSVNLPEKLNQGGCAQLFACGVKEKIEINFFLRKNLFKYFHDRATIHEYNDGT